MAVQAKGEQAGPALLQRTLEVRVDDAEKELSAKAEGAQHTLVPWPLSASEMLAYWSGNPWLAAIGNVLADAVSGATPELRVREVDTEGEFVDKSLRKRDKSDKDYAAALRWLLKPAFAREGVSDLSLAEFLRSCALKFDQTGNIFCEVLRNRGGDQFSGLSVLLPQFVSYASKKGAGRDFELLQVDPYFGEVSFVPFGERPKSGEEATSKREFLHQRALNSLSSFYGLPAWFEARDSVAVDNAHRRYLRDFFGNNASPRYLITITQDPAWQGEMPGEGVLEALFNSIRNFLQLNAGEMAGRNLVLQYPGGVIVRAEPLDRDLQDPTFVHVATNMRDEVLAVRHVSLIDLGLPENSNRATGSVQSENFRRQVLEPFSNPVEALLNRVLHAPPPYGLGVTAYDFALKFENVSDTLQRIQGIMQATSGAAILSPDEGRQIIGYEPKGDDTLYITAGMLPGGDFGGPDGG